jgi:4-oxalocrotonate tautomerase
MPWLQVNVLEGRDDETLLELMDALSSATARVLDVPVERVRVLINEVPTQRWGVGGKPIVIPTPSE